MEVPHPSPWVDHFTMPGAETARRRTLSVDLEPGPPTLSGRSETEPLAGLMICWGINNYPIPSGNLTLLLKITIFHGKTHYKWSFSIAMLVYQRVIILGIISSSKIRGILF